MPNITVPAAGEAMPAANLNRRLAILGGLTAAVALAAAPHADAAGNSDAELIRLGDELNRLLADWRPKHDEMDRKHFEWMEELTRLNLTFRCDLDECWRLCRETGAEAATAAVTEPLERIDVATKAIRSIPPQTLAGLGVWAKATRFDCLSVAAQEIPLNETDYDDECLIRLLVEIERMAGVS